MSIQISSINISANVSGGKQSADDLNKIYVEAGKLERRVETLTEKLAKLSNGFSAGTASARAYADALALQQRATIGSQAGISQLATVMQQLSTNIANISVNLNQNTAATNVNRQAIQQHNVVMNDARALARGLAGSLGALWVTYGNTAPLAAGLAIGTSFKMIVSEGAKFEAILASLVVKGEETQQSMNLIRDAALDIGKGIYGPIEVAKAFETLILAGNTAKEALTGIKDALNLATVGGTSIEKAAFTLTQVSTAMGYTAEGFSVVGDVIAKTAAVTMSSVESLSEAFKSGSSVGKLYRITLQDMATMLGSLAQLGIQGSAAGTSLKNYLKELSSISPKVVSTLKSMGLTPADFKDQSGGFLDMITVVGKLDAGIKTLKESEQSVALQRLSNERGVKTAVELLDAYRQKVGSSSSALQEMRNAIGDSGGYAVLAAARLAQTAEAQFKSTGNTLRSVFVESFKAIEPQITLVARSLREAFNSPEFARGIQTMSLGLANFGLALVENLPLIAQLSAALLALKAGTVVAAVFTSLGAAAGTLATGLSAAAAGTLTLSAALPAIGVVLGTVAAAFALYAFFKDKALDTSKADAAKASSLDFIENLQKENNRIEESNKLMREGVDAKNANAVATQNLALAERAAAHDKGIISLQYQRDVLAAQAGIPVSKLNDMANKDQKSGIGQVDTAVAAAKALQKAEKDKKDSILAAEAEIKRARELGTEAARLQSASIQKGYDDAKKAAEDATGVVNVGKKGPQGVNAIQAEIDATKRWIAGHEARLELINNIASAEEKLSGSQATAEAKSFLSSEAATKAMAKMSSAQADALKTELLSQAAKKDSVKYEEDKAKSIGEFTSKLVKAETAQAAYNAEEGSRTNPLGQYEREAVALAKLTSMNEKETASIRARAKAIDEETRANDNRKKGAQYAASSEVRAGSSKDEYENLSKYGIAVKQTASQLAELEIAKLQLNETTDKSIINDIREAASKETLWNAMKEIAKITNELNEVGLERAAYATEGVIGSETAKVTALQNANQKKLDLYAADARAQIEIQQAAGLITAAEASSRLGAIDAAMTKLKGNFAQSFKVAEFKDMATIFSDIGETVGKMGAGFDKASKALSGFAGAFKSLASAQEKERVGDKTAAADKIGAYGDMASAAGEFFEKQSTGYKVMQGVSTAFHAVQLAMNLKSMISGVAAGAAQMFAQSGWGGFAGVAAMGAVMAGLGFAISGGGGSGGQAAADVQKTQGSGTVFGDSTKQSESISNSIKKLQENSNAMLPLTNAMLSSLRNIESAMVGLGNLILRSSGVSDGSSFGVATGQLNIGSPTDIVSKIGTEMTKGLFGPIVGGAIAKVLNNVWGKTTQNIVDAGIAFKGTVAQLQSGQGYSQYASVDTTKSSFFGLKKKTSNSVVSAGLGDELSNQFAMIFTSLEDTLKVAAQGFGLTTSSVTSAIDNMVLDSKVSLKDLKGQDLTDAINNVISAAMDDISKAAIPGLEKFQQVGEGYAETVIRLASNYERLNVSLSAIGLVFNSFGLSSLTLREDFIKLAGGIDEFESKVKGYYDAIYTDAQKQELAQKQVSGAMTALGYASVTTKEQFKNLVDGLDLTNSAQQALFINLTALAPAFGAVADAAQEAKDSAVDAAKTALRTAYDSQSSSLQSAIDKLKAFQTTLTTFINSLKTGSLSTLTPMQKLAETKSIYEETLKAAQGGDANAQSGITAAAQAYLQASQIVNASSDAYTQATLQVQADLSNLAAIAGSQQTSAQLELDALNKQVQGLLDLNTTTLSVKEAIDNLGVAMVAAGLITKEKFAEQNGSHASGKEYIPFDNYNAVLHEGEAVIDAPAMAVLKRYFGATGSSNGSSGDTKALETKLADVETAVKQMGAMVAGTVIQMGNVSANKIGGAVCDAADKQIYANKSTVTIGGR